MNFNILETQATTLLGGAADAMQINVPAKPTVNKTLCSVCLGYSLFLFTHVLTFLSSHNCSHQ